MICEVMKDIDNYKGALSRFCSLACSAARYLRGSPLVLMIYEVMKDIYYYKGALARFCSLACSAARYLWGSPYGSDEL